MISKLLTGIAFLFILTTGTRLYADLEYYQYDGDVPMIEMMIKFYGLMAAKTIYKDCCS